MSFTLHGLGTALPATSFSQAEGLKVAQALSPPAVGEAAWLPAVYAHSGVHTRYQVLGRGLIDDLVNGTRECGSPFLPAADGPRGPTTELRMQYYAKEAPPLALQAAACALSRSAFDPRTITHLVTVSCTGFVSPGVDFALIEGLGLLPTVERTHVGFMGCHGAINGLRVANAYCKADPAARVLLSCVELSSVNYYYGSESDKVVANALFADGAAAAVGSAEPPADADQTPWRVAASGSCLIPNSAQAMSWTVRDHGFEMTLARSIPGLIAKHLKPWLDTWLAREGLTQADVASWAVHPGGPRILSAVDEGLALAPDALAPSRQVLAECGNMSSPTVLFIVEKLRRSRAPAPCVTIGFGPGLVAEAVLWR